MPNGLAPSARPRSTIRAVGAFELELTNTNIAKGRHLRQSDPFSRGTNSEPWLILSNRPGIRNGQHASYINFHCRLLSLEETRLKGCDTSSSPGMTSALAVTEQIVSDKLTSIPRAPGASIPSKSRPCSRAAARPSPAAAYFMRLSCCAILNPDEANVFLEPSMK